MTDRLKRVVAAVVLLIVGVAVQAVTRTPPVALGEMTIIKLTKDGRVDQSFLNSQIAFLGKRAKYIETLPAPFAEYRDAFLLARSEADYPKIRAAIVRELDANAAIEAQGLSAVPGLTLTDLTHVSLWLIALAAAVGFRALEFVLGAAFLGGLLHGAGAELNTLTGLTAEHYLAAILAALIVAALGWLALRRLWPPAPA